jgi:putative phosphoribosyl transferase
MVLFENRQDAGRQLARELSFLEGRDVVVLGLPRGGVPVAAEVARALNAPLDVIVVRKLGAPDQPELAIGAIGEGGVQALNHRLTSALNIDSVEVDAVERRERTLLAERVQRYRHGREAQNLEGRIAVIVDDGYATGATSRVACRIARNLGARLVILAIPVAPAHALDDVEEADRVIALQTPEDFAAVGMHYRDFGQTSDDEVVHLLDEAELRVLTSHPTHDVPSSSATSKETSSLLAQGVDVTIPASGVILHGHLFVPPQSRGLVVFAHGSGSSRHSPRNRFVASILNEAGLGTLLIDLLSPGEEDDRTNVFDINLLAARLVAVCQWIHHSPETAACHVGIFGASTGAGAALVAASDPRTAIEAVVSRGGRPDLAHEHLEAVDAPTLLIVGGLDDTVLALNREAQQRLSGISSLEIVEGATHLFEEPGGLEKVAQLATSWFTTYLLAPTKTAERQNA